MIELAPINERKTVMLGWLASFSATKHGSVERLEVFRQLKQLKADPEMMARYPELAQIPSYQDVYRSPPSTVKLSDRDMEFYRLHFRCEEKQARLQHKIQRRKDVFAAIRYLCLHLGSGFILGLAINH